MLGSEQHSEVGCVQNTILRDIRAGEAEWLTRSCTVAELRWANAALRSQPRHLCACGEQEETQICSYQIMSICTKALTFTFLKFVLRRKPRS